MRTAVALLFVAASSPLAAQSGSPDSSREPPQIVTSGVGEVRVTPDRAVVQIGVETRAPTAAEAAAENSRRQRAVIDTLRKLGIPRERISTVNLQVHPDMRHDDRTRETRLVGYVVTNTVRAEVERVELVGRVLDAALKAGANQMHSLSFYSSNSDAARREALAKAVAAACADAQTIARASGGSLAGVLELSSTPFGPRPMHTGRLASAVAAPEAMPVEPGQQVIAVVVTGRWRYGVGSATSDGCPR